MAGPLLFGDAEGRRLRVQMARRADEFRVGDVVQPNEPQDERHLANHCARIRLPRRKLHRTLHGLTTNF